MFCCPRWSAPDLDHPGQRGATVYTSERPGGCAGVPQPKRGIITVSNADLALDYSPRVTEHTCRRMSHQSLIYRCSWRVVWPNAATRSLVSLPRLHITVLYKYHPPDHIRGNAVRTYWSLS